MITVLIAIGNSDDKLTQAEWSRFYAAVNAAIKRYSANTYGAWLSANDSPWQNAGWCCAFSDGYVNDIKRELSHIAFDFRQDSIAWMEGMTELIFAQDKRVKKES